MALKDDLKQRRIELNLTMAEVAKKVGVSEATISRWESGDIANMRRDKIVLLSKALKVSPS
jgi:ORF020